VGWVQGSPMALTPPAVSTLEFLDEVWFDSMINNESCRILVMIAKLVDSLLVIVRRRVHVEDNTEPT
jgi:hypothetical protein